MHTTLVKPEWLKIKGKVSDRFSLIKDELRKLNLHTVCQESHCPNQAECWSAGTATVMVLGDTCTRACRFCNIKTAPQGFVDKNEPAQVVKIAHMMKLKYMVITSVTRDDLPDGGSAHFAACIRALKEDNPDLMVEVLTSNYTGEDLQCVLDANPDVFAHNIEVVKRLTPSIRDRRFSYEQSIAVLKEAKQRGQKFTKSSIMVGLGESEREVVEAMNDLREAGVDFLTIGQYMQPSPKHAFVIEYVHPRIFKFYEQKGIKLGFKYVASGPFVRSSYKAGEFAIKQLCRKIV